MWISAESMFSSTNHHCCWIAAAKSSLDRTLLYGVTQLQSGSFVSRAWRGHAWDTESQAMLGVLDSRSYP